MGVNDVVWMVLILAGAGWLLYRSLWKKKGHCAGCESGTCDVKKKYNSKDC